MVSNGGGAEKCAESWFGHAGLRLRIFGEAGPPARIGLSVSHDERCSLVEFACRQLFSLACNPIFPQKAVD